MRLLCVVIRCSSRTLRNIHSLYGAQWSWLCATIVRCQKSLDHFSFEPCQTDNAAFGKEKKKRKTSVPCHIHDTKLLVKRTILVLYCARRVFEKDIRRQLLVEYGQNSRQCRFSTWIPKHLFAKLSLYARSEFASVCFVSFCFASLISNIWQRAPAYY